MKQDNLDRPALTKLNLWVMTIATGLVVANIYYNQPLLGDISRHFRCTGNSYFQPGWHFLDPPRSPQSPQYSLYGHLFYRWALGTFLASQTWHLYQWKGVVAMGLIVSITAFLLHLFFKPAGMKKTGLMSTVSKTHLF